MSTPLGDFVRAKRDSIDPGTFGLPDRGRRRSPGLRRSDLAARAGISVEYLTRIEQGRDRNPSPAVVNALADGLSLDADEREHLRYLVKITGGTCAGQRPPAPPNREVRPTVRETLRLLEPAAAYVTNRLGDVLARTSAFEQLMLPTGLFDSATPNLTTFVFTDPRARAVFPEWGQVADEQAFDLLLGPSAEAVKWFNAQLAPTAGQEFTRRLHHHLPPPQVPLRLAHPTGHELLLERERLELPRSDGQQLVVLLPADDATAEALDRLQRSARGALRAIG